MFDLIAAEYGWTDDQILDLTYGRLKQVTDVVQERRDEEWRREMHARENATAWVVGALYGAAGSDLGAKMAASVRLIAETPEEKQANLPSTEKVMAMFGAPI